jgi:LmbE family N-acetylglucosaminyl deacetylase
MVTIRPAGPVLVISAHLDDAVLSCGYLLLNNPQSVVLTVLAGAPEIFHDGYNSIATGERYAPDAVRKRRNEDIAAMKFLSASSPIWLGFLDRDYLRKHCRRNDHEEMVRAIDQVIREIGARSIVTPLGFGHLDHVAVSNACIELAKNSDLEWYLYMDMPYAQWHPRALRKREAFIRRILNIDGLEPLQIDTDQKLMAFKLYESQYAGTSGGKPDFDQMMKKAERYWRVVR